MGENIIKHANIIYVAEISPIGGVETFVYEMAKKYKDLDIAVVCKQCDPLQAKRIRKYCKLYMFHGQQIDCKVIVINHDQSIINYVCKDAKIYQTIHADYSNPQYKSIPHDHPRVTSFIGITATNVEVMRGLLHTDRIMLSYNPLTVEKTEKPIIIVSATRLGGGKGKERIITFTNTLDRLGINYLFFIITDVADCIHNERVIFVKNRLNVAPWLDIADYVALFSDTEGCSYTLSEALYRNIPILTTPLPYLKEIGVEEGKNAYFLEFDCSNVEEMAKKISKIPKFVFKKMEDRYNELWADSKSTYEEDRKKTVLVRCIRTYDDIELKRRVSANEVLKLQWERAEHLVERGKVVFI